VRVVPTGIGSISCQVFAGCGISGYRPDLGYTATSLCLIEGAGKKIKKKFATRI
jgi:hypothetical protein